MIDVENAVGLEVSRIGPVTLSLFTAGTVLSGQNSAVEVNPLQQPSALSDAYQPTHGLRTAQQTWMKEPRQGLMKRRRSYVVHKECCLSTIVSFLLFANKPGPAGADDPMYFP